MFAILMCLALAPTPETVAPAAETVLDRFVASVKKESSASADSVQQALDAAHEAAADRETRHEAITAALRILNPEFDGALKKLAEEDGDAAAELLEPLSKSSDPYLAAEATLFLARARMIEGRFEESLPVVKSLIEQRSGQTIRLGEAWFLKGKLEAGALDREAASTSLKKFLSDFPGEPHRMQGEARATLMDLEEAESDLLTDIHSKMKFSGRRLNLADSGKQTQEVQDDVVALLTEMIDELEKKSGNCKGCKGACSKPGGGGMGGAAPGMSSGNSEASRITERNAPRSSWVDLSERQKDPSVFNAAKSRVPVQYRGLIEQYYQSFGEKTEK